MPRRHKILSAEPVAAQIESLSHEGRGIAYVNGKTTFIDGTLPGEKVLFQYRRRRARYDEGKLTEIINPSPERVDAPCEHYDQCGGCSLQHTTPQFQIERKQAVLLEQLQYIGRVQPEQILPPLAGPVWGYRRKARLSVKYVEKKGRVLVGFLEKYSPYVADLKSCVVLQPSVGLILTDLQTVISQLSVHRKIPQIEIAVTDKTTALVFRHIMPLTESDLAILKKFEDKHKVDIYLQPAGLESVTPLSPGNATALSYCLPEHNVEIFFEPTDFIQNNYEINVSMVNLALELLEPGGSDHVLDLFCGLGNFSLPLARKSARVTGVDGDTGLIERARSNSRHNKVTNIEFHIANLADQDLQAGFLQHEYQKVLLDPPRAGAPEIIYNMDFKGVKRIVYVSCNPATLARDAGILVETKGFHLQKAGVMDMFPHTSHIESIALFVR